MLPLLLAIPAFIALVLFQGYLPTVTDVTLRRTIDTGYAFTSALNDLITVNARRSVASGLLMLPSAPNSPTGPLYHVKGLSMKGPIITAIEHLNLFLDGRADPAYDYYSSSSFEEQEYQHEYREEQRQSHAHSTTFHAASVGDMSVLLFDDSRTRRPVCSAPARKTVHSISASTEPIDSVEHFAELLNRHSSSSFRALLLLALLWRFAAHFWRARYTADNKMAVKALAITILTCK